MTTTVRPPLVPLALANRPLQRIAVDGPELEFEERGSGEPVLLIHGGIVADAFAPLLAQPALTDRYRVISYHRRGFAGSTRPEGAVSIARQAADARAILDHLGIARAHVVGHSYGGVIALQLALDAPESVASLALLEPALLAVPSGEQFAHLVQAAFARYEAGDRAGAVDTILRGVAGAAGLAALDYAVPGGLELAATDVGTFFATEVSALQGWRFGPGEARRIGRPVLAVRGAESDEVAPLFGEGIALLREWLPQAEPFTLPAATHGMPFMNPGALAQELSAFFARHPLQLVADHRDGVRTDPESAIAPQLNDHVPSSAASPATAGTVKVVTLYGEPTDAAAFEHYYAETHVPLAHRVPGLQRLETARFLGTATGEAAHYHRIAELWFPDMQQFQTAVASPEGQALAADVANFATGGLTIFIAQVDASNPEMT